MSPKGHVSKPPHTEGAVDDLELKGQMLIPLTRHARSRLRRHDRKHRQETSAARAASEIAQN